MTTNQKLDLLSTRTTVTNKTLIGFTILSFICTVVLMFFMYIRYTEKLLDYDHRITKLETKYAINFSTLMNNNNNNNDAVKHE